jgi:uncharacterized protein
MDLGIPASELAVMVGALLAGGLLTGFLVGLLGVGGGGIMVPVLYEVFTALDIDPAIRMHMAVGTALCVMIPTSLRSFMAHKKRGGVDIDIIKRLIVPVFIGVALGSVIAKYSHTTTLKWIWVVFGSLIALKMLLGKEAWRLGDDVPKSKLVELYGVGVGAVSTLMSIGGGAYITTMLTLYGRSIQQAVGTSAGFGPMIALPGMLGFIWAGWGHASLPPGSLGYVSLLGAAAMIPASVLAAPLGARVAHGISRRTLELAFGIFVGSVVLRFLYSIYFQP